MRENSIRVKRIYEKPGKNDGFRVLVDRLWPRGISREDAKLDLWMKEIAPSNELRTWFHHNSEQWEEFRRRYLEELEGREELLFKLLELAKRHTVTLLYASKNTERNNALVLKELCQEELLETFENV